MADISQWTPKNESKHQEELDFVKLNPTSKRLIVFEKQLKQDEDMFPYLVYKYIFKKCYSWDKAAIELDVTTNRLTPIVDKLAFGIKLIRNM